jgi:hypothetical protein
LFLLAMLGIISKCFQAVAPEIRRHDDACA